MITRFKEQDEAKTEHCKKHGADHTRRLVDQCVEELAELQVALMHHRRARVTRGAIMEEYADVILCMDDIMIELGITKEELQSMVKFKANRLTERLRAGNIHA